ncbi:hypothetical protein [Tardiphaga sp.]|uniref:hypothetical protein n=1 Tax=Tardiphaga sp. TaxID=1926292 RepID=UPI00262A9407|nr:hypothetical protein [Tardiphaga sp.]
MLMFIGSASAFAWRVYEGRTNSGSTLGSSVTPDPKRATLAEFNVLKQQISGQMQLNAQALAARQAELKQLSEQLTAVSAKFDVLEQSMLNARAATTRAAKSIPLKKTGNVKPVSRAIMSETNWPLPIGASR